ncbi:MAG: dihydroneopterin aldolase [Ignavibacteriales bacterium]|nr:dihydroneopterin aldolase [Ignavibacteriota bacterium]MCB9247503.1 dihydroneopterin aldolase [Ignavibacteriales bacterium]
MLNVVRIKNAVFYAYHGALKEEQFIGGKFEADVDMFFNFSEAAANDDLKKTINYDEVYKFINKMIHEKKYYLIETIATIIADNLLTAFPILDKVKVKVRKNNVPVGGIIEYVEAEVEKSKNE